MITSTFCRYVPEQVWPIPSVQHIRTFTPNKGRVGCQALVYPGVIYPESDVRSRGITPYSNPLCGLLENRRIS